MGLDFSLAIGLIKIFGALYVLLAFGIIVYGIKCIISETAIMHYEEGVQPRWKIHTKLSIFSSILNRSLNLFAYPSLPKKTKFFSGESARLMGWIYVLVGLFMLAPVVLILFFF